jgi:hypothetical protein
VVRKAIETARTSVSSGGHSSSYWCQQRQLAATKHADEASTVRTSAACHHAVAKPDVLLVPPSNTNLGPLTPRRFDDSHQIFGIRAQMGPASAAPPRAPVSHLGSFRTYPGRAIADIRGNPQSISPKSGSGYLPGGAGPPAPPGPSFKICGNLLWQRAEPSKMPAAGRQTA